jgi:hypothetical protein
MEQSAGESDGNQTRVCAGAVGTALAVGGHLVPDDSPARAQGAAAPLAGHFHPKGKAPSKFTLDVVSYARIEPAFRWSRSDPAWLVTSN